MVTVQVPVPAQPPPVHPAKFEPASGDAVNVTIMFCASDSVQSTPQVMPVPVTVPVPLPDLVTVSRKLTGTISTVSNCAFTLGITGTVTPPTGMVNTHVLVPVQVPPLQPINVEPGAAVAVKVTNSPGAYGSLQSAPQLMPVPVTMPLPEPDLVTVNGLASNCAFTEVATFTVTLHAAVPVQPPLQPTKLEPAVAVAVSTTVVPGATGSLQSRPQLMPVPVTLPAPEPERVTLKVTGGVIRSNCAFTAVAALTVTLHEDVPLHPPPLQPAKVEPAVGVAVKATTVESGTDSEQSAPQLMRVPVTAPAPVPVLLTLSNTFPAEPVSGTQAENSDEPLMKFIATAVMKPLVSVEANVGVAPAFPDGLVLAIAAPDTPDRHQNLSCGRWWFEKTRRRSLSSLRCLTCRAPR